MMNVYSCAFISSLRSGFKYAFLIWLTVSLTACFQNAEVTSTGSSGIFSVNLSGTPNNISNQTTLLIDVGGFGAVAYKYKIGFGATDCLVETGYSAEISVDTDITDTLGADGSYTLCVVGKDLIGWHEITSAIVFTWTKDTAAPSATFSGQPTGINNTTSLMIDISGSDVTSYKYFLSIGADCSDSSSYSATQNESTNITDSLLALPDGTYTLCVVGADPAENWQTYASAATTTWTKDTTAPIAVLTSLPSNPSNLGTLAINIGGADVAYYQYKLGLTVDCSNPTGYSSDIVETTNITDVLGADGTYTLCVLGKDIVGNLQDPSSATTYTWVKDTTAPTVLSVTSTTPDGTYSNPQVIDLRINWSENVTVTGTPTLTLETGATDQIVNHVSTTDAQSLFNYTVGPSDINNDLDYTSTSALVLGGGTIQDAAGNAAVLTLPAPGDPASIAGSKSLNILGTPATLTITDSPTYDYGSVNISGGTAAHFFTVTNTGLVSATTMSESGLTAPFVFTGGSYPGTSGTCGATLLSGNSCTIDVTFSPTSTGLQTDTLQIDYNNGIIVTSSLRNLQGTGITNPIVTNVTSADPNGVYQAESFFYIQVTFDQVVNVVGAPYITLETGTTDQNANYASGSGTNTLLFYYYVSIGDYSSDLELATTTISLNGGTIQDGSSNNATLTLPISGAGSLSYNKNITVFTLIPISGLPMNINNDSPLNITFGGNGITQYKYALGAGNLDCSIATYSSPISIATPVTDTVPPGLHKICVLAADTFGTWTVVASAFTHLWVRDPTSAVYLTPMSIATNDDNGSFWGSTPSWAPGWNWMGWYSSAYEWHYLRFQLSGSLPSTARIEHAYLTFRGNYANAWNPLTHALKICAQNTANATQVDAGDDYPGGAGGTTLTNCVRWPTTSGGLDWKIQGGNLSVNIAPVIQTLVKNYSGLPASNYIQLWITADSPSTTGEVSYSYLTPPTLGISYTAATPTTMNPADKDGSISLDASNLILSKASGATPKAARATISKNSGQWYYEVKIDSVSSGVANSTIGIGQSGSLLTNYVGAESTSMGYDGGGTPKFYSGGAPSNNPTAYVAADYIGIAVDFDTQKIWFSKNCIWQGTSFGTPDPTLGTGQAFGTTFPSATMYYPMISLSVAPITYTTNFGQSAFNCPVPPRFKPGWY